VKRSACNPTTDVAYGAKQEWPPLEKGILTRSSARCAAAVARLVGRCRDVVSTGSARVAGRFTPLNHEEVYLTIPSYGVHVTKYLLAGMTSIHCGVSPAAFSIFACWQVFTIRRSCDRKPFRIEQWVSQCCATRHRSAGKGPRRHTTLVRPSFLHTFRKSDDAAGVPRFDCLGVCSLAVTFEFSQLYHNRLPQSGVFTAVQKHMARGLEYQTLCSMHNSIVWLNRCFI
jgi:hypothetical protein